MKKWFVLYTRPNQEIKVAEQLKEMKISCFCPTVSIIKQYSDRKKKVLKPLLPSYVFVFIAVIILLVTVFFVEFTEKQNKKFRTSLIYIAILIMCIYVIVNGGDIHVLLKIFLSLFFIVFIFFFWLITNPYLNGGGRYRNRFEVFFG